MFETARRVCVSLEVIEVGIRSLNEYRLNDLIGFRILLVEFGNRLVGPLNSVFPSEVSGDANNEHRFRFLLSVGHMVTDSIRRLRIVLLSASGER